MRYQSQISILLLIILIFSGCNYERYKTYYERTTEEWKGYLQEIGAHPIDLHNSVLLLLTSSECNPSIDELKWWDEYYRSNTQNRVVLIIIERYQKTFQTLLEFEEISIPAYRDSSGIVLNHKLIPATPIKILFDEKGNLKKMAAIGTSADAAQENFLAL